MHEVEKNSPAIFVRPIWHSWSLRFMTLIALVGIIFWWRRVHFGDGVPNNQLESSAMFRFGGSFVGGFFIGWAYRKSIHIAALIFGAVIGLISLAKWTGLIQLEWDTITQSLHDNLTFFEGEALKAEKFLAGLLPSGMAGALGVFKGARHK